MQTPVAQQSPSKYRIIVREQVYLPSASSRVFENKVDAERLARHGI